MTKDDRVKLAAARVVERLMNDLMSRGFMDGLGDDARTALMKIWRRMVREELER